MPMSIEQSSPGGSFTLKHRLRELHNIIFKKIIKNREFHNITCDG